MGRYRAKSVVEAYIWQPGLNLPGIEEVDVAEPAFHNARRLGRFVTMHGKQTYVDAGNVVIKEVDGEHWYTCDLEVFAATYEAIEE